MNKKISIDRNPQTQLRPLLNGTTIKFSSCFRAPKETSIYKHFTVTETLPPGTVFICGETCISTDGDIPVAGFLKYNRNSNTMTAEIENTPLTAGRLITVKTKAMITDTALIPDGGGVNDAMFYSTAKLTVNNDSDLTSESEPVMAIFQIPEP